MRSARNCAAPDAECLITTMSIRIASRFRAVSTSVSPLDTLDPEADTLTVSAERRFSANSNEMRVRVDISVDWKLASTAVDQDRKRDRTRASEIRELVEGRAYGAARVEDVVDDHDVFALQVPRQIGRTHHRARSDGL